MNITVLTPDKKIFEGPIISIKVPGTDGQFMVLKNHAPIVSSLEKGKVEIVTSKGEYEYYDNDSGDIKKMAEPGKKIHYQISGGFIEVLNNEISLLIESLSAAE